MKSSWTRRRTIALSLAIAIVTALAVVATSRFTEQQAERTVAAPAVAPAVAPAAIPAASAPAGRDIPFVDPSEISSLEGAPSARPKAADAVPKSTDQADRRFLGPQPEAAAPQSVAAPRPVHESSTTVSGLATRNRYGPKMLTDDARARQAREQAQEARRSARVRALAKDQARRSDDSRLPLVPHHAADDRFGELRILEHSSMREMTFFDYGVNPTISTEESRVSTFAVDVDSASYGLVRSYLQKGTMPDETAVRVEEMINAFDYAYAAPEKEAFLVQAEAFPSPHRKGYHVLHLGLKGRELSADQRKPAALVFVVDVSGSMEGDNRLGLVKRSLTMLTRQLDGRDSVSVVVYGTDARVVLEPTRASQEGKHRIVGAITALATEGSTNVEAGLELGYRIAARPASAGTNARVILCSDGMANVGATAAETILERVKEHAERGVTISTVGFGMGHYNDVMMERLADKGNGNYAYVDNVEAAQRVFVEQLGATLEVIAKDVKIQVAFDKTEVARYRLLGFENRMLDKRDFDDDRVDAGEIGAGHTVTAIYEIKLRKGSAAGKIGTLRVRYKAPKSNRSELVERAMPRSIVAGSYAKASAPTKLSMVVAAFAEKLRGSYWARNHSYSDILRLWDEIPESLRLRQDVSELRSLIVTASSLDHRSDRFEALLPVAKMDFDRVPVLY